MAQRWVARDFGPPSVLELEEYDVAAPGPGEVTVDVRASGLNPVDYKTFSEARRGGVPLPIMPGYEVAGIVTAVGPDTEIGSGPVAVGDEVLAFRISGGLATELTLPAGDVFAKPSSLGFAEAANLLLVGSTAADLLRVLPVESGSTVLVHGASGAVGVSLLQQIGLIGGVTVVGTASQSNREVVERYGATWVPYGDGLADRVREVAPSLDAAYILVEAGEAFDVSLELLAPERIAAITQAPRAEKAGIRHVGGAKPDSAAFRAEARPRLIGLAGEGKLVVPVARTFPFDQAPAAYELLATEHPGGKIAVVS